MDTELARTFLSVLEAGSFVGAAERLHLTQSTVSARIQSLERGLGARLFVRHRGGANLTDAGRRFHRHASALVRTVAQARQDVGADTAYRARLSVGARIGLWDGLLADWLAAQRADAPDVAVSAEIGFEADLMQGLVDGRLDLGVMYTPQARPGLVVERLLEETLVLVASDAESAAHAAERYVHVDWGPEFFARHRAAHPAWSGPGVTVNIGWLGRQHLERTGGAAYFPERLVAGDLGAGRLVRVTDAPAFSQPAYAVYAEPGEDGPLTDALARLRARVDAADG